MKHWLIENTNYSKGMPIKEPRHSPWLAKGLLGGPFQFHHMRFKSWAEAADWVQTKESSRRKRPRVTFEIIGDDS